MGMCRHPESIFYNITIYNIDVSIKYNAQKADLQFYNLHFEVCKVAKTIADLVPHG